MVSVVRKNPTTCQLNKEKAQGEKEQWIIVIWSTMYSHYEVPKSTCFWLCATGKSGLQSCPIHSSRVTLSSYLLVPPTLLMSLYLLTYLSHPLFSCHSIFLPTCPTHSSHVTLSSYLLVPPTLLMSLYLLTYLSHPLFSCHPTHSSHVTLSSYLSSYHWDPSKLDLSSWSAATRKNQWDSWQKNTQNAKSSFRNKRLRGKSQIC